MSARLESLRLRAATTAVALAFTAAGLAACTSDTTTPEVEGSDDAGPSRSADKTDPKPSELARADAGEGDDEIETDAATTDAPDPICAEKLTTLGPIVTSQHGSAYEPKFDPEPRPADGIYDATAISNYGVAVGSSSEQLSIEVRGDKVIIASTSTDERAGYKNDVFRQLGPDEGYRLDASYCGANTFYLTLRWTSVERDGKKVLAAYVETAFLPWRIELQKR